MKISNKSSLLMVATVLSLASFCGVSTVFAAGPQAINLGSASNFAVLSKAGISATGATFITGNIGVSPAAATFITGFGLTASTDTTYSTTPLVSGKAVAANYSSPTPTILTTAIGDMQGAYTDGAGRSNPTATELGAGNIGGLTIAPGLYKWGTGVVIPSNVTLSGGPNDIWIFQIAQTLTVSSGVKVVLSGGAQAANVYWVVAGQTTLGTTADFSGNILGQTAIVLNTGARLNGRALAQTAVTLDANAVTSPTASAVAQPVMVPVVAPIVVPVTVTSPSTPTPIITVSPASSQQNVNVVAPGTLYGGQLVPGANANVNANNTMNVNANVNAAFGQQVRMLAHDLGKGSNDNDVTTLQSFLISQNKGPSAEALAKVGATGYFGNLTRASLAEFQLQAGISPAVGNFGPITRAYVSSHF